MNRVANVIEKLRQHGQGALNLIPTWEKIYNKNSKELSSELIDAY